MDQLTKSAHFITYSMTYPIERISRMYLQQVVHMHRVAMSIVSDRDAWFTLKFWESLQEEIDTSLKKSTAFHP